MAQTISFARGGTYSAVLPKAGFPWVPWILGWSPIIATTAFIQKIAAATFLPCVAIMNSNCALAAQ